MKDGASFGRYLRPKIKAAGWTEEHFAVEKMKLTKGAINSWWRTGKIGKGSLNKISQIHELDAPLWELMAALDGKDPTAAAPQSVETTSASAVMVAANVRRMVRFVPNYKQTAEAAGINAEVLEAPEANLRNATLLDLDLVAEALNTKPWLLLHEHTKELDQRKEFVEELLKIVAETNDEGRQVIVDAMKSARRIGELTVKA